MITALTTFKDLRAEQKFADEDSLAKDMTKDIVKTSDHLNDLQKKIHHMEKSSEKQFAFITYLVKNM